MLIDKSPTEAILAFVFFGNYSPSHFDRYWLFSNDIIDKSELSDFKLKISDSLTTIESDSLSFEVSKDRLMIKTYQIALSEYLYDIAKVVHSSIYNLTTPSFTIVTQLHFDFRSKNDVQRILNRNLKTDSFDDFSKFIPNGYSVERTMKRKSFIGNQKVTIDKCMRTGNENNIHLYIKFKVSAVSYIKEAETKYEVAYGDMKSKTNQKSLSFRNFDSEMEYIYSVLEDTINYFTNNVFKL